MHFVITFAHMTPAAGTDNRVDFMGILEKKILLVGLFSPYGGFLTVWKGVYHIHLFGCRDIFSHYVETILQKLLRALMLRLLE